MKEAKKRTIYNNYNLWEDFSENAKDNLNANDILQPTESQIWDEIYEQDEYNWNEIRQKLTAFFSGSQWLLIGTIGRWNGEYEGGFTFSSFDEMWRKATEDCSYFDIYDKNGHLYIDCSHHDGNNHYEIKKITARGEEYLSRNMYMDPRQLHKRLFDRYSSLPNFVHSIYGMPRREYDEENKEEKNA